jgi:hypothetical protein
VFDQAELQPLLQAAAAHADAGGPAWHRGRYRVRECPRQGLAGGWDVEVLWLFNHGMPGWEAQLPAETQGWIAKGRKKEVCSSCLWPALCASCKLSMLQPVGPGGALSAIARQLERRDALSVQPRHAGLGGTAAGRDARLDC